MRIDGVIVFGVVVLIMIAIVLRGFWQFHRAIKQTDELVAAALREAQAEREMKKR